MERAPRSGSRERRQAARIRTRSPRSRRAPQARRGVDAAGECEQVLRRLIDGRSGGAELNLQGSPGAGVSRDDGVDFQATAVPVPRSCTASARPTGGTRPGWERSRRTSRSSRRTRSRNRSSRDEQRLDVLGFVAAGVKPRAAVLAAARRRNASTRASTRSPAPMSLELIPCQVRNHSPRSATQSVEKLVRAMESVLTSQIASPPAVRCSAIPARALRSSSGCSR
jgi:hypothetical protein